VNLPDAVRDDIRRAVAGDAKAAGRASDAMRRLGLKYREQFEHAREVAATLNPGFTLAEWDELLAESDDEDDE